MQPTHTDIQTRSYYIWERQGRPSGRALEHWLQAETELHGEQGDPTSPTSRSAAKKATRPRQPRKSGTTAKRGAGTKKQR